MKKFIIVFLAVGIVWVGSVSVNAQRGQSQGRGQVPTVAPRGGQGTQPQQPRTNQGGKPADTSVGTAITRNPKLMERLTPLLPPNMTLDAAAAGFKNQGQFIAALMVSKNLEISFETLKAKMTAAEDPDSLGEAIQAIKQEMTEAQVEVEVEKAEEQAEEIGG